MLEDGNWKAAHQHASSAGSSRYCRRVSKMKLSRLMGFKKALKDQGMNAVAVAFISIVAFTLARA